MLRIPKDVFLKGGFSLSVSEIFCCHGDALNCFRHGLKPFWVQGLFFIYKENFEI